MLILPRSIPNMIPLSADDIAKMWSVLKPWNFTSTYGAFNNLTVHDKDIKKRILESMKIQVKHMGYADHALLSEAL